MMLVKVITQHSNGYGDRFEKDVGSTYELPDDMVETLIGAKLVKRTKAKADDDAPATADAATPVSGSADAPTDAG